MKILEYRISMVFIYNHINTIIAHQYLVNIMAGDEYHVRLPFYISGETLTRIPQVLARQQLHILSYHFLSAG